MAEGSRELPKADALPSAPGPARVLRVRRADPGPESPPPRPVAYRVSLLGPEGRRAVCLGSHHGQPASLTALYGASNLGPPWGHGGALSQGAEGTVQAGERGVGPLSSGPPSALP